MMWYGMKWLLSECWDHLSADERVTLTQAKDGDFGSILFLIQDDPSLSPLLSLNHYSMISKAVRVI